MKKTAIALLLCSTSLSAFAASETDQITAFEADSKAAALEMVTRLQGMLQAEVKANGPVSAINLCSEKSPELRKEVMEKYKLSIGRVTDKNRNPKSVMDKTDKEIFATVKADLEKGGDINAINAGLAKNVKVYNINDQKQMRSYRGIAVQGVCLGCHGADVKPAIKEAIAAKYPGDMATGYKEGDLRGLVKMTRAVETVEEVKGWSWQ